jgi:hypothetical protein
MATATALARARPAKITCNPTPTSQIIGPEGPKHPGNRQLYDKRGCPDAGAPLCGNHADTKVATFCAALWLTFTLPLTHPELQMGDILDVCNTHDNSAAMKSEFELVEILSPPLCDAPLFQ